MFQTAKLAGRVSISGCLKVIITRWAVHSLSWYFAFTLGL